MRQLALGSFIAVALAHLVLFAPQRPMPSRAKQLGLLASCALPLAIAFAAVALGAHAAATEEARNALGELAGLGVLLSALLVVGHSVLRLRRAGLSRRRD